MNPFNKFTYSIFSIIFLIFIPSKNLVAQCSPNCGIDNSAVGETSCIDIGIPYAQLEVGVDAINTSTDPNIIAALNGNTLAAELDNCCIPNDNCVSISFTIPQNGGCFILEELNSIGSGSVYINCEDVSNKFNLAQSYPAGEYDLIFCPPGSAGSKRIGFAPLFVIDAITTNESCDGMNDGTIDASYTLGSAYFNTSSPVVFSIDGIGGVSANAEGIFTGLSAGTYTIYAYEQDNPDCCFSSKEVTIQHGGPCQWSGGKEIAFIEIEFECDASNNGVTAFNEALSEDLDGDGVIDKNDPDPTDPNKAFVQYKPSMSTRGTWAFEDLWPMKGDYDFNDFVVEIQEIIVTNANNKIKEITYDMRIMSMGGQFNNDFGISLPDPHGDMTVEVFSPHNVTHDLSRYTNRAIFTIQKPKQLFYPNSITDIINAEEGGTYYAPIEIQVVFSVNGKLNYPNQYDPKFFIEQQGIDGHEVHMPGKAPTPRAKSELLGTIDDDTQPGNNKYYKTAHNLPWALYIPTTWNYPVEGMDLTKAYNHFATFAQSNPNLVWYQTNQADPLKTFNGH